MSTDLKRQNKYNQRRTPSVLVVPFTEAMITDATSGTAGSLFATLPANVQIMYSIMSVTTGSGTASSTVQVKVNGSNLGSAMAATTASSVINTTSVLLPTGGNVELVPGATAPATGSLVGVFTLVYVELDATNGEYTN